MRPQPLFEADLTIPPLLILQLTSLASSLLFLQHPPPTLPLPSRLPSHPLSPFPINFLFQNPRYCLVQGGLRGCHSRERQCRSRCLVQVQIRSSMFFFLFPLYLDSHLSPKWMLSSAPVHHGPEQPWIQMRVLGTRSSISLVRSLRSLICLLHTACFVRALRCAHSIACSLTDSLRSSWERLDGYFCCVLFFSGP